jgi:hypothetical protein
VKKLMMKKFNTINEHSLFKPAVTCLIILVSLTSGSFILANISSYIQLDFLGQRNPWAVDRINEISPLKYFVFAPIVQTLLLYLYFKTVGKIGGISRFILLGIAMGLFHDYYQPGAFLPFLWSIWIMSFGYYYLMAGYGVVIAIIATSIIHSINNIFVYLFF